jgi:hypothetical protein
MFFSEPSAKTSVISVMNGRQRWLNTEITETPQREKNGIAQEYGGLRRTRTRNSLAKRKRAATFVAALYIEIGSRPLLRAAHSQLKGYRSGGKRISRINC